MTTPIGRQAYRGNTITASKLPQPSSLNPKQASQKGKTPTKPIKEGLAARNQRQQASNKM
jgi:hypothetical protein